MTKINRQDYVDAHGKQSLNLDKLKKDEGAREQLAQAGSSVEQVAKADLNNDGKVSGKTELEALFRHADHFDRDGFSRSLVDLDGSGKRTAAGNVLAAVEGSFEAAAVAPVPTGPTGKEIAQAALDRIERFGDDYGVPGAWKSCNPGIPGNKNPDKTSYSGMKGRWKCNLYAMDTLHQAGFQTPTYGKDGKGWYPVAVDLHNFAKGPNRCFDNKGEVKLADLDSDARKAAVEDILSRAQPGDLIIVNHNGPDAADGGHCRVVTANNFATDGTVDCAQASSDAAKVKAEGVSSFTGEEVIYLLRPCRLRAQS